MKNKLIIFDTSKYEKMNWKELAKVIFNAQIVIDNLNDFLKQQKKKLRILRNIQEEKVPHRNNSLKTGDKNK